MNPVSLIQMTLALFAVIAIIVILAVLVRRFSLLPGASSGMIRIIGGMALNSKDRLLLVQVGDEQILISASPGRVSKVHDLQKPLDPQQYRAAVRTEGRSFSGLLDSVMQRSR